MVRPWHFLQNPYFSDFGIHSTAQHQEHLSISMNSAAPIKLLWEEGEGTRKKQLPKSTWETTTSICFCAAQERGVKEIKWSVKKSNRVFVTKLVCLIYINIYIYDLYSIYDLSICIWSIFYTFLWCCGLIFDALPGFLDFWFLHDHAIAHWWLKFFQVAQECKILSADSQLHLWYSLISASQAARGPSHTFYFISFYTVIFAL